MFKIERVKIDSKKLKCYYECENKFVFEILKHITTYLKKLKMDLCMLDKSLKVPNHFGIKEVLESGITLLVIYEQIPIELIEMFENHIYKRTISTFSKIIEPTDNEIYLNRNNIVKELYYEKIIDIYNNKFRNEVEAMLEESKNKI